MKSRREFLVAGSAGLCALAAPCASFAQQQGKVWRVGFLAPRRPVSLDSDVYGVFPRAMRELGYVEGKNLVMEWRFADGHLDRLPALAAELVQLKVDVLVTAGEPATSAASKATGTIPIVMDNPTDPVAAGVIKSLARPGGNVTGLFNLAANISPKYLESLRAINPKLGRAAVLFNPGDSSHVDVVESLRLAGNKIGMKILPAEARTLQEIEAGFAMMVREQAAALVVATGGIFNQHERRIAELAIKHRLPSIASRVEYTMAGGLMNYGPSRTDNQRRMAGYVDRILKGAKPGELPVQQSTVLEMAINRKTATALGLTIPQALLISADRVIE